MNDTAVVQAKDEASPRKQVLERAAEARAKIIAYLSNLDAPYATLGNLKDNIPELAEVSNLSSLLATMVNNKLVQIRDVDVIGPYKVGYFIQSQPTVVTPGVGTEVGAEDTFVKRAYNRKQVDRPEVRVESDRIVIDHPRCRIIVELK